MREMWAMEELQNLIPIQYLIVAAVVLAVLFVITLLFRALAGRSGGAESSRLGVSEILDIDKNRRLILLRRDNVEHLVLVGGGQDLVVEAEISPGLRRREDAPAMPRVVPDDRLEQERDYAPAMARPQEATRPVPLRATRPAVFGESQPPMQPPSERPEPRLEALGAEEKSREA
jgi:hypothetical protein